MILMVIFSSCSEDTEPYTSVLGEVDPPPVAVAAQVAPPAQAEEQPLIEHLIITQRDMPLVLQPPRARYTSEKELTEYPTLEIEPNIFFETNAAIRSTILAESGILYFGNEYNEFYALDVNTSQVLWTFSTDEAVQTRPVLENGKIIFNAGNSLYILDAVTGEEIHIIRYPSNYDIRMSHDSTAFNDSHVAVSDGIAYFVALNGNFVAVDILSGEIAWTIETSTRRLVVSGVKYYDGKLFYVLSPGILFAVDIQTRQVLFETHIGGMPFNPMTIYDGRIYIGGRNRKFYCIDASTGEVIWRSHSQDTMTWFSGGSVIIGNNVFATTSDEDAIIAFDKGTGEFQRIYSILSFGYTPPLRHGNNVVVASTNIRAAMIGNRVSPERSIPRSYVMAIDTEHHTKLWIAPLDDTVLSPPTIYQDVLYFGSDSGVIYSIDLLLR